MITFTAGSALWTANIAQIAGLYGVAIVHSGSRHWRKYRDLQHRECSVVQAAAIFPFRAVDVHDRDVWCTKRAIV